MKEWKEAGCNKMEVSRRLIDLFFVSVLLDAGAGDHWRYREPGTDSVYERSEGIAVASLHMFQSLAFTVSENRSAPLVDGETLPLRPVLADTKSVIGKGLSGVATKVVADGFQVTDDNPMLGVSSRAALLSSLGESLLAHSDVFGVEGRPGNLVGKELRMRICALLTSLQTI